MKNIVNTEFQSAGGVKPSSNATFPDLIRRFFEGIKKKCCELSLVNSELTNNKQSNYNNVNSPLSWIIASLWKVAHFTSVVIRNDNKGDSPLTTHNSLVKAIAFTLAETLVVMGIIGVVAALTIPNLNQSTGDKEKVAKLKKIHSNLEDAFGPIDEWESQFKQRGGKNFYNTEGAKFIAERLMDFMKISKNCDEDITSCFKDKPLDLDGKSYHISTLGNYFILADGTSIGIAYEGAGIHKLYIDIDGPNKGSNTYGKDLFYYYSYTGDRNLGYVFKPEGSDTDDISQCLKVNSCFLSWVLQTGNMDYLKANKGVCPNGTTLSWENTSCK